MILKSSILLISLFATSIAFQCSPDTILRMATDKRAKQLERECHEQKTSNEICATKDDLEKSWKEFQEASENYKEAVTKCRKYVEEKSRTKRHHEEDGRHHHNQDHKKKPVHAHKVRRHADHDPTDPNIDHTGHNHRRRRHQDHDPTDPNIDHTGHNHRRRRHQDHDPTDPNIDHTGHNHRRRRHQDHDPTDPNIDHTGHNHRRRRHQDHDPTDPNIDHTGHNHRRRRHQDHDPTDPNIDHTGHNHRRRRHQDHDPNNPNIDHTGHNHKSFRARRQTCSISGQEQLASMSAKYNKHCERENICLAMEDLPAGQQRDEFNEIHKLRAKKYSNYLTELSKCYGKV